MVGYQQEYQQVTGSPSGDSNGIGSAKRTKAASGAFNTLDAAMRHGDAMSKSVDPSRSRANRLSDTVERAIPQLFSNNSPACSNARFLLDTSRSSSYVLDSEYLTKMVHDALHE